MYTQECVRHESTRQSLQEVTSDLHEKAKEIKELKEDYETKLEEITAEVLQYFICDFVYVNKSFWHKISSLPLGGTRDAVLFGLLLVWIYGVIWPVLLCFETIDVLILRVLDGVQMETRLASERADKEREISIREEKLSKLKKQMAEALKGNSWWV